MHATLSVHSRVLALLSHHSQMSPVSRREAAEAKQENLVGKCWRQSVCGQRIQFMMELSKWSSCNVFIHSPLHSPVPYN